MDYSDVFRAFDAGALGATPEKNAEEAHRQLEELAQSHPNLLAILKNKGVGAMERAVAAEDAQYRNMYAGFTSAKKARDDADNSVFEGGDTGGSGMGTREDPLALKPDIKTPGPVADSTGTTPTAADTTERDKVNDEIAQKYRSLDGRPMSADGMQTARDLASDKIDRGKLKGMGIIPGTHAFGAVTGAAADINNRIQKSVSDPHKSIDDRIKDINNLDPERGATVEMLLNGDMNAKEVRAGGAGPRLNALALAHQVNHDFNENIYALKQQYQALNGPATQTVSNAGTMYTAAKQILNYLKFDFKESGPIPAKVVHKMINENWDGGPKYAGLYQAITQYATSAAAMSTRGVTRQGILNRFLQHMSETAGPAQIRHQVKVDTIDAYKRIDELDKHWKNTTKRDDHFPGFDPETDTGIKALMQMNANTQQMPDWAPEDLKALSKAPTASDRPSWRTKELETAPLTQERTGQIKAAIEKWKNDPAHTDDVQQLRELLQRKGVY
jgi:hypothetical protein